MAPFLTEAIDDPISLDEAVDIFLYTCLRHVFLAVLSISSFLLALSIAIIFPYLAYQLARKVLGKECKWKDENSGIAGFGALLFFLISVPRAHGEGQWGWLEMLVQAAFGECVFVTGVLIGVVIVAAIWRGLRLVGRLCGEKKKGRDEEAALLVNDEGKVQRQDSYGTMVTEEALIRGSVCPSDLLGLGGKKTGDDE